MTRFLIAAATILALTASMASAQAATRHSASKRFYDQVATQAAPQAPMLFLGVAY